MAWNCPAAIFDSKNPLLGFSRSMKGKDWMNTFFLRFNPSCDQFPFPSETVFLISYNFKRYCWHFSVCNCGGERFYKKREKNTHLTQYTFLHTVQGGAGCPEDHWVVHIHIKWDFIWVLDKSVSGASNDDNRRTLSQSQSLRRWWISFIAW